MKLQQEITAEITKHTIHIYVYIFLYKYNHI